MKLRNILFVTLAITLTFSACKSKKEEKVPLLRPASMVYTAQDSADIWKLCEQFAQFFGQNDFESCALMLNKFENDSIHPYTDQQRKEYIKAVQIFSNYGCRVDAFTLRSDRNNSVSLKVKLFPVGTLDDDQGITHLVLNPVKVEDTWYLTLRDQNADGVEEPYK
jgi:hypothetical protein